MNEERSSLTHAELVAIGERWLRKRSKPTYAMVLSDVRCTMVSEQPDVIGWTGWGASLLIECKTSRSDFRADEVKDFRRRHPEDGMGVLRYYLAPPDVIPLRALDGLTWGLLEPNGDKGKLKVRRLATPNVQSERGKTAEKTLLLSALKRATEGWGRRMFGEAAPAGMVNGDAHPTASRIIKDLHHENRQLRAEVKVLQAAMNRASG